MPDYEVYRRAAARAARAEPLYRPDDGHYQFKYLPAFAVATLPVGIGQERVVRACWFAVTILLLVVLLRTTAVALPEMRRSRAALIGATFVLLAKFYAHEIELGQVNILMTTLVVLAVVQIRANREIGAGLLVAAAVVVKPYAVLLGALPGRTPPRRVARWHRHRPWCGADASALLYGFAGNLQLLGEWWRTVTETTAPNLMDFNNVSAASVFARWLGPGPTAQALATAMVAALLAVAVAVFAMRARVSVPEPLEVGLLLTLIPLISPQGWDYVFLLSTLAVMSLVNYSDQLPRYIRAPVIAALLIVAFSIFDLIGRPPTSASCACR